MQTNQLIDLQEHFERYCNTLPVFGFNSAKHDMNLIKSYLLPNLANERQIERAVIRKANQFVSFKFSDVQLLDFLNFLGRATNHDSFLKAYKTEENKGFSPMSGSTRPKNLTTKNYLHRILSSAYCVIIIFSKKITTTLKTSLLGVLSSEQAVCKLRLNKILPTGDEKYAYLRSIWVSEGMKSSKDFLM